MEEYLNVQYLGSSNALLITAQGIFLKAFIQTGLGVNSLWHRQTTASQILTRDICSSGVQNENTNPSELILVQPGNSNIHGKAGPILFKEFFSVVSTSCLSPGIFRAWLKDSHPIKRQDLFLQGKVPTYPCPLRRAAFFWCTPFYYQVMKGIYSLKALCECKFQLAVGERAWELWSHFSPKAWL